MTVKEFYDNVGGSYVDVINRFGADNIISRFLKMLLKDNTIVEFKTAIAENNIEEAFRHAHTMKGLLSNLGLTSLYNKDFEIVEFLRKKDINYVIPLVPDSVESYNSVIELIEQL